MARCAPASKSAVAARIENRRGGVAAKWQTYGGAAAASWRRIVGSAEQRRWRHQRHPGACRAAAAWRRDARRSLWRGIARNRAARVAANACGVRHQKLAQSRLQPSARVAARPSAAIACVLKYVLHRGAIALFCGGALLSGWRHHRMLAGGAATSSGITAASAKRGAGGDNGRQARRAAVIGARQNLASGAIASAAYLQQRRGAALAAASAGGNIGSGICGGT